MVFHAIQYEIVSVSSFPICFGESVESRRKELASSCRSQRELANRGTATAAVERDKKRKYSVANADARSRNEQRLQNDCDLQGSLVSSSQSPL